MDNEELGKLVRADHDYIELLVDVKDEPDSDCEEQEKAIQVRTILQKRTCLIEIEV